MNIELLKNNYLVVPNFISPEHAEKLRKEFHLDDEKEEYDGDPQAPNSSSIYNYLPALELLANKTSHVSEIVGETVLPTYVYSRIYRDESVLTKHTDRPSCEISVTLHLGGDKPWPIWIETPEKEQRSVTLNPGDGMLYLGCVAPHWRNKFEGSEYTQFFLHYVRSRGCFNPAYFDQDPDIEDDLDFLIEEYQEMNNRNGNKNIILPKKYRTEENNNDDGDNVFFKSISKQRQKFNLDPIEDEEENFIDFDDVVVCNSKYEKFLTKKTIKDVVKENNSLESKKTNNLSKTSLKDFIWYKEEFIDPEFCDEILEEYVETDYWTPTLTGGGHDPEARRCSVICVSEEEVINDDNAEKRKQIDNKLFEIVKEIYNGYQEDYPDFDLEIVEDSGYELLKYEVGDFYRQHTDHFKTQPRSLTVIMSMNDAYDGGEFAFFDRELVYKMNAGDVLVFPSHFMFPHEIIPVTSGTRYSMITWLV